LSVCCTTFTYKGHEKECEVERFVCSECGEELLDDEAMDKVEPGLRRWRREVDGLMSGEDIRHLRRSLGLTQRQMGAIIGSGPKSFAKYETGAVNQSKAVDTMLRVIRNHPELLQRLARERKVDLHIAPRRLLLVWKEPTIRLRYLIGNLWQDRKGYHFCYERQLPRSLAEAVAKGFTLLEGFDNPDGHWEAAVLFPVFNRRLPSRDNENEYEKMGLVVGEEMEFLRQTGGRVPTDTLEFLEPIEESPGKAEYTILFPIAGWRYYQGEAVVHELGEGTRLRLELEHENHHDPGAVKILSPSNQLLGYVPAVYAWYIDGSVESGAYRASVHRIGSREDPQIRVRVDFSAQACEKPLWHWRIGKVPRMCGEILSV